MTDWMVAEKAVIGTSPMELPHLCIVCGRQPQSGRRLDATLYWAPRWIWFGILWGVVPVVLLYYAARRPLKIEYSLCGEHLRSLRLRKHLAQASWVVLIAAIVACVVGRGRSAILIVAGAIFLVTLVLNMMAWLPLRVAGHEDGVFGVRGFSKEFLTRAAPLSPRV